MASVKDLRKRRFGRLMVVKRHEAKGPRGDIHWVCKCDCGQKTIVSGRNLRYGSTKSCGCLHGPTKRVLLPRRTKEIDKELDFDHIEGVKLLNGQVSGADFKNIQRALGFTNPQMADAMRVSTRLINDIRTGKRRLQPYMQELLWYICWDYRLLF